MLACSKKYFFDLYDCLLFHGNRFKQKFFIQHKRFVANNTGNACNF